MHLQVKEKMEINAPASKVWRVIAHEFEKVGEWSSGLKSSEASTGLPLPKGATVAGRVCYNDGFGDDVEEAFTYYDEAGMRYGYEAIGDVPLFFNSAGNNWQVEALDKKRSLVQFRAELDAPFFPGVLMLPFLPIMKKVWGTRTLKELKYYIENGQPHPRKLKAQQKQLKAT